MDEGGNLMDHMNVFNKYLDQLRKVDVKVEEEDKALLLLTSLPDSYENLMTTLLHGKDTVSLEQVQASLVSYDTQKKKTIVDDGHETTLAVQGWNRGRKLGGGFEGDSRFKSSSKGKGLQCYDCKEFGHKKKNYPLRKRKDDLGPGCSNFVAEDFEYTF
ncbi:hypothetical protein ACFX1Z_005269 [Malus domestica]